MEDKLIMLTNKAEELRKSKNISLLEAYNLLLAGYNFSSFSEEQLRNLIMILKTELFGYNENKPIFMKLIIIFSFILSVLGICLGNLIPIEIIKGLWYTFLGYCTLKSLTVAVNRLRLEKTNKIRQSSIAEHNINTMIALAYNESISRDIKEELTKDNNKCAKNYIEKLLKAIEELIPLVSYGNISLYSMESLRLRRMYNNLFKKSNNMLSWTDIDVYKNNPELLVQQLERLLDDLIEETAPASVSNILSGEVRKKTNKK